MFFGRYTTAVEQTRGELDANLLIARYRDNAAEFFGDAGVGQGDVEASILIGDRVYELSIELSRKPSEDDGIFLTKLEFDAETRELEGGAGHRLPGTTAPLTWPTLVDVICQAFQLDPNVVWNTGVDVQAYWRVEPTEEEYLKVPPDADRAKYSLAVLHQPPH